MEKIENNQKGKGKNVVGTLGTRGRKFEGKVIKKFDKRVTIEFERVKLVRKYERYIRKKSKMHAYLPKQLKDKIEIGDLIQVQECRPISKIQHHIVIKKMGETK